MAEGLDGGFYADAAAQVKKPLVILFAHDLEAMEAKVRAAGGTITRPIFSFPGGRRFHFTDPSGNELCVFSGRENCGPLSFALWGGGTVGRWYGSTPPSREPTRHASLLS